MRPRTIPLLQIDQELASVVPAGDRLRATRFLPAALHELPDGPFCPQTLCGADDDVLCLLVVDGLVSRELSLGSRPSMQLLTAGDVFRPAPQHDQTLPIGPPAWRCHGRAAVAVLDRRVVVAARRWPQLLTALQQRLHDQFDDAAAYSALLSLSRVDDRLLALFWHVASKIGRVTGSDVVLELPVTHETLGMLVAAKRPTVSLALAALAEAGMLRREDGCWRLARGSLQRLDRSVAPTVPVPVPAPEPALEPAMLRAS